MRAAACAPYRDAGGNDRGTIHIHFLDTDGSVKSTVEVNSGTANGPSLLDNDWYGSSVTSIGDLDGDNVEDLVVGAPGDDTGGDTHGAAHIHFMNANGSGQSNISSNEYNDWNPVWFK